jgi:parallel beta-helix repeat protein
MKGLVLLIIVGVLGAMVIFGGCEQSSNVLQPKVTISTEQMQSNINQLDFSRGLEQLEQTRASVAARTVEVKAQRQSLPTTLAKSKAQKLTVPDQYPTIQSAVDAAAPGTQIIVKKGTYDEVVLLRSGLELIGKGKPTVTRFEVIADSNVVIKGFNVNGSGVGILLSEAVNCTIQSNTVYSSGGYGILLMAFTNGSVLKNNDVKAAGAYSFGITVDSSYNNTIQGNVTSVPTFWGMLMLNSDGNKLVSNKSTNNLYGIGLFGCSRNAFSKNQFRDNRAHGMFLSESDGGNLSNDNIIGPNNRLERNGGYGIFLFGNNNTVKKNIALGNTDCDIADSGTGNVFTGNKVGCITEVQ